MCLNDLAYFKTANPTTENLAQYIFDEFGKVCQPLKVKKSPRLGIRDVGCDVL